MRRFPSRRRPPIDIHKQSSLFAFTFTQFNNFRYPKMSEEISESKNRSIVVSKDAVCTMLLHASKHGASVVHGVLMGKFTSNDDALEITQAVPVCHEPPTKTLVDTSLALIASASSGSIVGWYTAPERITDTKASAPALRIVASLANSMKDEPVLIVLQNGAAVKSLRGETDESVLKVFGKDFGQQWLEPLNNVTLESGCLDAARKAYQDDTTVVNDFVDHLESESGASTPWYPN